MSASSRDATAGAAGRLEDVFRREYPRLVAAAVRVVRDLDAAEEVVQDALAAALDRWPLSGPPENPAAWLMTVARNRAVDVLRRRRRLAARAEALARESALVEGDEAVADPDLLADDRLRLVFTCCHPALAAESQVALTLRLVAGLATPEIARAFLVSEATVAQRIVRAKRLIRARRLPYVVPAPDEMTERLPPVLSVIYLVFNEGYVAHQGDRLLRADLCGEAIRLAGNLVELMPGQPEVLGLAALLELQASRAHARTDAEGALVLLADQDRCRWDQPGIARGLALLDAAGPLDGAGPYQLQAAIAACHARAPSWEVTDWKRIASLYAVLEAVAPSPVVGLNRAAAVGMADGPEAGLAALEGLDPLPLARYHLLPATRADFLRRLGRHAEAAREYTRAIALTANHIEQSFLRRRLNECIPSSDEIPEP